jgi:hypothetical protein
MFLGKLSFVLTSVEIQIILDFKLGDGTKYAPLYLILRVAEIFINSGLSMFFYD